MFINFPITRQIYVESIFCEIIIYISRFYTYIVIINKQLTTDIWKFYVLSIEAILTF